MINNNAMASKLALIVYRNFVDEIYARAGIDSKIISNKIDNIVEGVDIDEPKFQQAFVSAREILKDSNSLLVSSATEYRPLRSILANISLEKSAKNSTACYQTAASTIDTIFARGGIATTKNDYQILIAEFEKQLNKIPTSHEEKLDLWLDHFSSLFEIFAQNIPAFAGDCDLSLYDYARVVAAMTIALYSADNQELLLIQGDFFGIQEFIFANGGETKKNVAKLLRGRSFYVSLLMEVAALKLTTELGLGSSSVLINVAGKFIILAADNDTNRNVIKKVEADLSNWFAEYTHYQSGIGLAYISAELEDFKSDNYSFLMKRLFKELERAKFQRLSLCNDNAPSVLSNYLDKVSQHGVCAIDGVSVADSSKDGMTISRLAKDHIMVGEYLTKYERLIVTDRDINHQTLSLDIFGYYISFTYEQDITGKFGNLAKDGSLRRVFDYSLPAQDSTQVQYNGYARRAINAYVPIENEVIVSFDKLSTRDQQNINDDNVGIAAITTVKGDVDDLGAIFQKGIKQANFARYAALSRQINSFFSVYLPYLCKTKYPNMYTVFAGGDDFFLIGPWKSAIDFAHQMQQDFARYVNANPDVHFSTGLSTTKVGIPVPAIADMAEEALEKSKAWQGKFDKPKNSVTCFGQSVKWSEFDKLKNHSDNIEYKSQELGLSTAYIYSILHFIRMSSRVATDPRANVWRPRFRYKTYRMLQQKRVDDIEKEMLELQELFETNIENYKKQFRIPLFINLYLKRK